MLLVALAAAVLGTAAQEGEAMADQELRKELEALWSRFRTALAEYRLDDVAKLVEVPKDAPRPSRAQAKQFAESLPDLATARFLKLVRDGDRAGYYARTETDKPGTAVAVIRFRKTARGWELVPGPQTISVYSTDEALDEAKIRRLLETEATLTLRPPEGEGAEAPPAPPAPTGEAPDARPEAEIRKELEGIWRKARTAFATGKPRDAADVLLWVDGATEPGPDEAKAAAKAMPDLARTRFIKLAWSATKPHLAGYVAEVEPGNAKKTSVAVIVFVRKDGAWKLAPGPRTLEVIELPPTGQAALKKLVDADPRFGL